jgi:hypothetical protein
MTGKMRTRMASRKVMRKVRRRTNKSDSTVVERVICVLFERESAICNDLNATTFIPGG